MQITTGFLEYKLTFLGNEIAKYATSHLENVANICANADNLKCALFANN